MKSDTPRTDSMMRVTNDMPDGRICVPVDFCRQLERELGEAKSLILEIARYPIHSEPMGGALDMQDRAFNFIKDHP